MWTGTRSLVSYATGCVLYANPILSNYLTQFSMNWWQLFGKFTLKTSQNVHKRLCSEMQTHAECLLTYTVWHHISTLSCISKTCLCHIATSVDRIHLFKIISVGRPKILQISKGSFTLERLCFLIYKLATVNHIKATLHVCKYKNLAFSVPFWCFFFTGTASWVWINVYLCFHAQIRNYEKMGICISNLYLFLR